MTSSSSSSFSSSKKSHAVIETIADDTVHVTRAYQLEQFSRDWVDCPANWPQKVVWFNDDDDDVDCRILKIDTKDECDNYATEYEQTKAARHSLYYMNGATVDATVLVEQINTLKGEVDDLKKTVHALQSQVSRMGGSIVKIEDDEKYKEIGQYGQRVEFSQLMIALAAKNDLEGYRTLVGAMFGSTFEADKKNARMNYENFPEKQKLWELMAYFCHCSMMLEDNPELRHGSSFPDYPTSSLLLGAPSDNNPSSSSGNPPARNRRTRCGVIKIVTPLRERTQKLCISYAKSFTNYYQEIAKGDEERDARRLREKNRRAQKKLEAEEAKKRARLDEAEAQVSLIQEQQQQQQQPVPLQTIETFFPPGTEMHHPGTNYY